MQWNKNSGFADLTELVKRYGVRIIIIVYFQNLTLINLFYTY